MYILRTKSKVCGWLDNKKINENTSFYKNCFFYSVTYVLPNVYVRVRTILCINEGISALLHT